MTAFPDGRPVCGGVEYPYLFWEGRLNADWDTSKGFAVTGGEVEPSPRDALPKLCLSETETNDFIACWQPLLAVNPVDLICFHTRCLYTQAAVLGVYSAPDTVIRVRCIANP